MSNQLVEMCPIPSAHKCIVHKSRIPILFSVHWMTAGTRLPVRAYTDKRWIEILWTFVSLLVCLHIHSLYRSVCRVPIGCCFIVHFFTWCVSSFISLPLVESDGFGSFQKSISFHSFKHSYTCCCVALWI